MTNQPSETTTDLFVGLTPDAVLDAIESTGLRCNNVCYALNSFENRVYEVELANEERTRLVAKFYRPQRWSDDQIRAEHRLLHALAADDVPVCDVVDLPHGDTIDHARGITFCLFPRKGGRAPEEIDAEMAERLGVMTARIHNVAARLGCDERDQLGPARLDRALDILLERQLLPSHLQRRYVTAARELREVLTERLDGVPSHAIHGDLHPGNLILRRGVLHVLDFDDMAIGPAVQDLWLLLPGRDAHTLQLRRNWLTGYKQFRTFDERTLNLIEPLRGLRYVHYAAWLAKRWHDPIFPQTWPEFGTERWAQQATRDLEDVLGHLNAPTLPGAIVDSPEGLSNQDYFWDME
ncbi:MAG: serine/threonine protein kinase [Myxococcales bacterium]|nr:serine/threonine protein kinase [Myxococcales bacterium]